MSNKLSVQELDWRKSEDTITYKKPNSLKLIEGFNILNDYIKGLFGHGQAVVVGSFHIYNVGDLATGVAIKKMLTGIGFDCTLNGCHRLPQKLAGYKFHIIGGGGILSDGLWKDNIKILTSPIIAGRPSAVFGPEVDKIYTENGKMYLKKLEKCKYIMVRSEYSKQNLKQIINNEIDVGACPSFMLEPSDSVKKIKSSLGVAINPFGGEKIETFLLNNLKILSKDYEIHFIPFVSQSLQFYKDLRKKCEINATIHPLQSPQKTLDLVAQMDRMIVSHFHSHIFSILAGVPFFSIDSDIKMHDLIKNLSCDRIVTAMGFDESRKINFTISPNEMRKFSKQKKAILKKCSDKLIGILSDEL